MNQYPIDLSISLGYIIQKEVASKRCLFSREISSACFANQIMKYMTGISSVDCYFGVCLIRLPSETTTKRRVSTPQ